MLWGCVPSAGTGKLVGLSGKVGGAKHKAILEKNPKKNVLAQSKAICLNGPAKVQNQIQI